LIYPLYGGAEAYGNYTLTSSPRTNARRDCGHNGSYGKYRKVYPRTQARGGNYTVKKTPGVLPTGTSGTTPRPTKGGKLLP